MSYILPGITDVIRPVIGPVFRQSGATPLPPWTPAELFTASAGFWYDVSAFANVNQTSTITTPVTAFEQNVGAVFDFSTGATPYPRFNLLSYTEDLSNAYWSKANVNLTANATAAPDSTVTADLLVANTSNIEHAFLVNDILPLGTTTGVTLSVYAKAAGYNYALVRSNGLSSNIFISGSFDLINGTAAIYYGSGNAGVTGSVNIVNAGNGWYQCLLTINTWGNVDPRYSVRYDISSTGVPASNSFGGQPFAGNNVSGVYFWGTDFRFVGSTGPSYQPILATTYSWPANPALQSTSGFRSVIRALYNALIRTEEFNDAAWGKFGMTVTANTGATTAPDGSSTADLFVESTGTNAHIIYRDNLSTSAPSVSGYRHGVFVKAGTRNVVALAIVDTGSTDRWAAACYDLATGTVTKTQTGASNTVVYKNSGIDSVGNSWYWIWIEATGTTINRVAINASNSTNPTFTNYGEISFAGNTANNFAIWRADARRLEDTYNLPTNQNVVTDTSYGNTAFGFTQVLPQGVRLDGTDDFYTVASVGGATTGFFFAAAIRAERSGAAQTLFSDTGTNTGFRVWIDSNNKLCLSIGDGFGYLTVRSGVPLLPLNRYVVTAWCDGAGLAGVRVNNSAYVTAGGAGTSAGTSTITIGKDNGASTSYFQGWIYGALYAKDIALIDARTIDGAYTYLQALNLTSTIPTDPGVGNVTQTPAYALISERTAGNVTQTPVYAMINDSDAAVTQVPVYVITIL